jgi:hypothetical protein
MEHPIVVLFKPLLEFEARSDATSYLLEHPVLTSPYYEDLLKGWASSLGPAQQEAALRALALKNEMWDQIGSGKIRLSASHSRILELSMSVMQGKITEEYACQVASRPEFFVELMFPVVNNACQLAEELVHKQWRPVVSMMRVIFAALDARRAQIPENQLPMDLTAAETWLAIARTALCDVPDGRIYHDAVQRGEALADLDTSRDPPGPILHRLGVLHLDPYVSGRSSQQLDIQLRAWQSRLEEEYGDELAGISEDEIRMPPIEQALPKAVEYFRRAALLRSGIPLGQTLKGIAQALMWQDLLELPVDRAEIVAVAQEAVGLLPVDQFPAEHAELAKIIERFGQQSQPQSFTPTSAADAAKILETPVSAWVERIGAVRTADVFGQSAASVQEVDPMLALRLWLAIEDLTLTQSEARRDVYYRTLISYVRRALVPDTPSSDGTPIAPIGESLFALAHKEKWNEQRLAYALLWLAVSTTKTDQEDEGLKALAVAEGVENKTDALFERLVRYARAMLHTGSAVNAYNRSDFAAAASQYANAIGSHIEANQPLAALDMMRRMIDLAKPSQPEALEFLVAALATHALKLELAAGNAATNLIQFACRHTLAALTEAGKLKLTVILFLWDAAKGRRFSAALAEGSGALPWLQHPHTLEVEEEMARLRPKIKAEAPVAPHALDEEVLLTSYVSPKEMRGGATAAQQLRNMQIRFDTALDVELSRREEGHEWIPKIEDVQELLDEKTVLMLQYIGVAPSGMLALTTLLLTKEESEGSMGILEGLPSSSVVLSDGEETATSSLLSFGVSALRSKLMSPPGPRVADSRALEQLEADMGNYLGGPLVPKLAALRAKGKDHLCIIPHGPLHYYPYHLLGPEDKPLAEDWCVTYLPNLRLLARADHGPGDKKELSVIGVNFDGYNVHGLPPIYEPEPEAQTIAATYGTEAIVGKDATESAVMRALAGSRRVHIATHGRHNVSAPAFQCLYVQPDEGGDGLIYAYELLRLDLRGLDLVTLSACETALGRFDVADNLRGIPAALLIAGVSTIVGTLWPVETNTTTLFFELFYKALKNSGTKRQAFYAAQKQTRAVFPDYWNWGAFQLIGSWE